MKLRNSFVTAGLATVAVAGSIVFSPVAPVQALTLNAGDTLLLNGGGGGLTLNPSGPKVIDFFGLAGNFNTGPLQVTAGSSGGFSSLVGHGGRIKDLTNADIANGLTGFIRVFAPLNGNTSPGDDLYFDLAQVITSGITPIPGPLDVLFASFRGAFRGADGAILGSGLATIQLPNGQTSGNSSWSMSIVAEPVPTPALLPGLAAFGMSLVRKRKQEQAV
jgi:hypothetical protein